MAKGNPLMGHMRGKVGDLVFTRLAGEQVTKTRNAHPKNPQTTKQMAQRLQLETCVEFYKQGREAFFKFAFEGKPVGNSDYNAFVAANIGRVPCNTKAALRAGLTCIGEYMMTDGTLPTLPTMLSDNADEPGILVHGITGTFAQLTVGSLSKALIDEFGYQDGDYLTVVGIWSNNATTDNIKTMKQQNALAGNPSAPKPTYWNIKQMIIDTNSAVLVSTLGMFETYDADENMLFFATSLYGPRQIDTTNAVSACVSRDVIGGAKVSTSKLVVFGPTLGAINTAMSPEWFEYCGNTFDEGGIQVENKDKAILEGSIATKNFFGQ